MNNKKHKHHELIKAWADGAEIEIYNNTSGQWFRTRTPSWLEDVEYRIKTEPKEPEYVPFTWEDSAELMGKWMRSKTGNCIKVVTNLQVLAGDLYINGESGKRCLEYYTQLNGKPFGKLS